ncbi:MAG: hypothetical protein V3T43_02785 [Nitrosomonadaceae bacterium]
MTLKEKINCSCGPSYFPVWAKAWLSKDFEDACSNHDYGYLLKDYSRLMIDYMFLMDMLWIVKEEGKGSKTRAWIYFFVVLLFGWYSWRFPGKGNKC